MVPKPRSRTVEHAFGTVVRQHRERLALSQEELAFRADLHRTYISMLERGERCPSLGTLVKLAKALGTRGSALLVAAEKAAETDG
ncbi:MAG: helix-turn-helix transcriptional regulator [Planctomycetes bacterium]|nr:helix-turn-helix transcriptional regulator [Planctomycetota bacterium]